MFPLLILFGIGLALLNKKSEEPAPSADKATGSDPRNSGADKNTSGDTGGDFPNTGPFKGTQVDAISKVVTAPLVGKGLPSFDAIGPIAASPKDWPDIAALPEPYRSMALKALSGVNPAILTDDTADPCPSGKCDAGAFPGLVKAIYDNWATVAFGNGGLGGGIDPSVAYGQLSKVRSLLGKKMGV